MSTMIFGGVCYGLEASMVPVTATTLEHNALCIVGLPEGSHKEQQWRVRAAMESVVPARNIQVTVGLPDFPGSTVGLDLPIAVAKLCATMNQTLTAKTAFFGELSLDGYVRPIRGILPLLQAAKAAGFKHVVVPSGNQAEALLVPGILISFVKRLGDLAEWLAGEPTVCALGAIAVKKPQFLPVPDRSRLSWDDLGQPQDNNSDERNAKLQHTLDAAVKVRAAIKAGKHVLLVGPTGSGKTMLAHRASLELPPMTEEETLESTANYSIAGLSTGPVTARPFRAPHHTISDVGIVGSARPKPLPGEASLAHNGVLFLDELPEFRRNVLGMVSYVLEKGESKVIRYNRPDSTFPANTRLVAAMSICPCGHHGSTDLSRCSCSPAMITRYSERVSTFVAAVFGEGKGEVITIGEVSNPF